VDINVEKNLSGAREGGKSRLKNEEGRLTTARIISTRIQRGTSIFKKICRLSHQGICSREGAFAIEALAEKDLTSLGGI